MIDIRQSPEYAHYLSQIGWTVKRINGINYFIKRLPLIGSILKIQRPKHLDTQIAWRLGKKYTAFQIIIEPTTECLRLTDHDYKLSKSPFLPTRTLQLDLTFSRQKLLKNLKKDARLAIRRTTNYELRIMKNVQQFRETWKKAVGLKRYIPPLPHLIALKKSFGNNCLFLTAGDQAGAIFLKSDEVAYYWQAFTNKKGRKLQLQYKIVWQGILWAKKKGAKIFDFEGIFDPRFPNKSWLGFTHFKKSFGGKEVNFPGCYTKLCLDNIFPRFR